MLTVKLAKEEVIRLRIKNKLNIIMPWFNQNATYCCFCGAEIIYKDKYSDKGNRIPLNLNQSVHSCAAFEAIMYWRLRVDKKKNS
jgi:hypothetical protein